MSESGPIASGGTTAGMARNTTSAIEQTELDQRLSEAKNINSRLDNLADRARGLADKVGGTYPEPAPENADVAAPNGCIAALQLTQKHQLAFLDSIDAAITRLESLL